MSITEEQYEEITDKLDAHDDFFYLGDLAGSASNSSLLQDLDKLHSLAKRALEYAYCEDTHDHLETLHEKSKRYAVAYWNL